MGKVLILNGSPRAPRSNSAKYAELFMQKFQGSCQTINITKENHNRICSVLSDFTDVLLIFPLYADGIPAILLDFLKDMESCQMTDKPVVSVIVNCGFREAYQNDTAVEIVQFFCKKNGFVFGSALKIGSGEVILDTPFRFLVKNKIKKMASAICSGKKCVLQVTMPLSASSFVKASTNYWLRYGQRNGITREEMDTMEIEN